MLCSFLLVVFLSWNIGINEKLKLDKFRRGNLKKCNSNADLSPKATIRKTIFHQVTAL